MLSRACCSASSPDIPAASKNMFMDCCVRAPRVFRRNQMCRLRFDLRTRRNREPATLTLGIFCVRTEISCDQKQLRSRTASTWISLYAHRDMFLQNDCCDLAPPDRLMHTKMLHTWIAIHAQEDMDLNHDQQTSSCDKNLLRSRAAGTLGSHSVHNETSSCDKTAAFSRRKHTWISLRAQRDIHVPAKRLWRSRAAPNIDDF